MADAPDGELHEFFGELKVGVRKWRQLRAELRLADCTVGSLRASWRADSARARASLEQLLPEDALAVVLGCLDAAADTPAEEVAGCLPDAPKRRADVDTAADWRAVYDLLPLVPPAGMRGSEGEEQRRRAFQMYVQRALPKGTAGRLEEMSRAFHRAGFAGARTFLADAWLLLRTVPDREHVFRGLVASQTERPLQLALRMALLAGPGRQGAESVHCLPRSGCDLLAIPEASAVQCLAFCGTWSVLCFSAASRGAYAVAEQDVLWPAASAGGARAALLRLEASCCRMCGVPTRFEHVLAGGRLCELCEKSHSCFALVRAGFVMEQYQLSHAHLRCLPHFDGVTGRVYLHEEVKKLAAIVHEPEELQRLRRVRSHGESSSGRQRDALRKSRCLEKRKPKENVDPCCFEATALIRAGGDV